VTNLTPGSDNQSTVQLMTASMVFYVTNLPPRSGVTTLLVGKVTSSLPVGRALGGAMVGAVGAAGNAVGSAAVRVSGVGGGAAAGAHGGAGLDADDAGGRSLTWSSALVDPPRRVRRLIPVGLHSLPGVTRLVAWTMPAVINCTVFWLSLPGVRLQ
jgi:hypothetical protein